MGLFTTLMGGGSPPRVRGKDPSSSATSVHVGITPACAGKSHCFHPAFISCGDHPRVCGEKQPSTSSVRHSKGSPPRVRGKGLSTIIASFSLRITPACAGKSDCFGFVDLTDEDHPRVCGEKEKSNTGGSWTEGSPPRVRGKGALATVYMMDSGITPACAGKSERIL